MLKKEIKGQKAFIYCRVSSKEQSEGTSLDEQETICMNWAKKYDLKIEKIYREDASAMTPETRKQFNEMVQNIQKGVANIVIFAFVDRMSRNAVDGYKITHLIEKKGLTGIFVHEQLYLQSPIISSEMLVLDTILGVSNYRVRQDREKCLAGIKARALEGFRANKPPYGYANDKKRKMAVVKSKRAKFVKVAFELYATGRYSITELIEELYYLGYRYELQPSKKIPKPSLISILKNPFYTGEYYVKQAEEYVIGNHEPIISKEVFDKVQEILKIAPRTPRKHNLTYSKLITCENCGRAMVGDVKKRNNKCYIYYRCTNPNCTAHYSISETKIDDKLAGYLKEIRLTLISKELIQEVLKEKMYQRIQNLAILKQNKSRKYHEEVRFREFVEENEINDKIYIQGGYETIKEKYGDLDSKIAYTEKNIANIKYRTAETFNKCLSEVYSSFSKESKRKILELVANSFKCTEKGLKMTFKSAFRKIRKR